MVRPVAAIDAKRYSGEPISVNLKDVDLKDFFRLIHEISGLNVVLDPVGARHGHPGSRRSSLGSGAGHRAAEQRPESKSSTATCCASSRRTRCRREADTKRDLVKAQTDAVEPETVTRVLSYAKASELVAPLKRFLTPRGDVMAIDRSNTLIIRDIPDSMPGVDNLIRQLDRKSQQVEIEARVVQASRTFARDIGTQFGIAGGISTAQLAECDRRRSDRSASQPDHAAHRSPSPGRLLGATNSIPLLSNFPANAPTSGLIFSHVSPNFALDYIITAAESKGVGKLLSSPQLVTQNNAMAVVKQGSADSDPDDGQ